MNFNEKEHAEMVERFGKRNYNLLLQDISREQFNKAYKESMTGYWYDILNILLSKAEDIEVKAHLLGFRSEEHHQQMLAEIKKKQERL